MFLHKKASSVLETNLILQTYTKPDHGAMSVTTAENNLTGCAMSVTKHDYFMYIFSKVPAIVLDLH